MANPTPSHYPSIGELGEHLVAQCLQFTGLIILQRRFSCRWGEIDIIAQSPDGNEKRGKISARSAKQFSNQYSKLNTTSIIYNAERLRNALLSQDHMVMFTEVKTRSSGNWDVGGRSAITPEKQKKIWHTARLFLAQFPEKADYPCRFDVAIVSCQRLSNKLHEHTASDEALATLSTDGYHLALQEYIPAAFDS